MQNHFRGNVQVETRKVSQPSSSDSALWHITKDNLPLFDGEKYSKKDKQELRAKSRPSLTTWHIILTAGDFVVLTTALLCGSLFITHLHPHLITPLSTFNMWQTKLIWSSFAIPVWSIVASMTQTQNFTTASNRFKSPFSALLALTLTSIFWSAITYFFFIDKDIFYKDALLAFIAVATPLLCAWRTMFVEIINLPLFRRRSVIVGVNTAGLALAKEMELAYRSGITVLGFVNENDEVFEQNDTFPVFQGRNALRYLVQHNMVDMIIMTLDYKAYPELFQEVIEATQHGISVVPVAKVYEIISGKLPVKYIGDQWYINLPSEAACTPLYVCWSRLLDLLVGLCGMLLLGLIFLVLAPLILLSSRGPIFYSQERMGMSGKTFRIYKFRSMYTDSEARGRAIWAKKEDTRITWIGRFMRATHIDETPQVFNILRGDMSLIGPRPERAEFVASLEKTIPFYRCRLSVKPGLTGWAQVKYRYGNTEDDALIKLQYDLYYIKHRSFMLDVFIMVKTIGEVLFFRGV